MKKSMIVMELSCKQHHQHGVVYYFVDRSGVGSVSVCDNDGISSSDIFRDIIKRHLKKENFTCFSRIYKSKCLHI